MSIIQRGRGGYIEVSGQLEKAKHVRWAVLYSGKHDIAASDMLYIREQGKTRWSPMWCSYIETPDAKIMVDTGPDIDDMKEKFSHLKDSSWKPEDLVPSELTTAQQLEKIGVDPDEVNYVIYTHLHLDHTGGTRLFKKAKHIPQMTELRYAVKPDNFGANVYMQSEFLPLLDNFAPIEGDAMIVPGIYCFETPGHTPGSQVILVMPEKGQPWLLAGDACYLRESYVDEWPGGIVYDPAEFVISIRRQKEIVNKLNAKHYPGHDIDVLKEMKKAPEWQYNDY